MTLPWDVYLHCKVCSFQLLEWIRSLFWGKFAFYYCVLHILPHCLQYRLSASLSFNIEYWCVSNYRCGFIPSFESLEIKCPALRTKLSLEVVTQLHKNLKSQVKSYKSTFTMLFSTLFLYPSQSSPFLEVIKKRKKSITYTCLPLYTYIARKLPVSFDCPDHVATFLCNHSRKRSAISKATF